MRAKYNKNVYVRCHLDLENNLTIISLIIVIHKPYIKNKVQEMLSLKVSALKANRKGT